MDKRERAERAKQEDAILNRVLIWIAGSVILEALLLLLNRYYVNARVSELAIQQGLYQMFGVLAIVLPIAFVACAVWWFLTWKKGEHALLPQVLTTILAVLAVCAVVARLYPNKTGISALYVGVPCLAVLALVYYLYQHEFFLVTLLGVLSGLGLWMLDRRAGNEVLVYVYLAVEVVVLIAVAVLTWKLQTSGGLLSVQGKLVRVFTKNTNYAMLYVSCAVALLVQVAALVLGSMMVLYGVVIVWLLAMAVYYTVRLM